MKILLEAPILTRSGYGEHARLVYRSLKSLGELDLYINALEWGFTSWTYDNYEEVENIKELNEKYLKYAATCKAAKETETYDIQIQVGIPSEFKKKAEYSVCVTAGIETDRISFNWLSQTHKGIDKLVVPSEHAAAGFAKTSYEVTNKSQGTETVLRCGCPVEVVPYPTKENLHSNLDIDFATDFNFLTIALLGQRKNIENSVKWFVEEFRENPNIGFVLKTSTAKASILDREQTKKHLTGLLETLGPRKCKVYLLHGDLSDGEIHSLYTHPKIKVYVTSTYGEGYGLPIFEAAYSGMPVIATDWSGHLDFLSAPFKENGTIRDKKLFGRVAFELKEVHPSAIWEGVIEEGSRWAHPIEKSFKQQIAKVYKNYGMYKKWAAALQNSLNETHSEEKVLDQMKNALIPKEMEQSLIEKQEWALACSEIEIL